MRTELGRRTPAQAAAAAASHRSAQREYADKGSHRIAQRKYASSAGGKSTRHAERANMHRPTFHIEVRSSLSSDRLTVAWNVMCQYTRNECVVSCCSRSALTEPLLVRAQNAPPAGNDPAPTPP